LLYHLYTTKTESRSPALSVNFASTVMTLPCETGLGVMDFIVTCGVEEELFLLQAEKASIKIIAGKNLNFIVRILDKSNLRQ